MGLFGFGKKKTSDVLEKQFKDKKITLELKDGKYSFELVMQNEGYSLYPYFTIDEEKKEFSIIINLRTTDGGLTLMDWERINSFNLKSKYLMAKVAEDQVLYLEYNAMVESEKTKEVLDSVIESVFMLSKEIDEL